jgi:hypothetical protein
MRVTWMDVFEKKKEEFFLFIYYLIRRVLLVLTITINTNKIDTA